MYIRLDTNGTGQTDRRIDGRTDGTAKQYHTLHQLHADVPQKWTVQWCTIQQDIAT